MAKFNMMELLNNNSKETLETKDNHERFRTIQININDIEPSPNNFYSVDDEKLIDLKNSIEILGLQQNLVVRKRGGKYQIIAGHRRYLAMKKLYEEGNLSFEYIPCKVEEDDHIRNELKLLMTNSTTRELSDWEKITQANKLKELLTEYKKKEKLPGRVRDIIADILNTSPTQVGRMESISKNLVEEFKDELKEGNIKISVAHELSKLPEEKQKEVFEDHEDKKEITIKVVKEKENEEQEIEVLEGQITVEEALNINEEDLKVNTEEVNIKNENCNSTLIVDTSTGEVLEEKTITKFRNKIFVELEDANLNDRLRYDLLDLVQEYDELISKYKNSDLHINFISNSVDEGDIQIVLNSEGIEIKAVDHFDLIEIYNKIILIAH